MAPWLFWVCSICLLLPIAAELTADGKNFMVDDISNFKIKHFDVYGERKEDTWGFVSSSYLPLNHKGFKEILDQCDFEADKVTMHEYGHLSTVNYYPNTPAFRKFKGIDMIPENKNNYVRREPFAKNLNFEDRDKVSPEPMYMRRCRIPQTDGGAWHVQRVGPFRSTGGYDWWQIGWSDSGMLSEALRLHPEGVDVVNTVLVPVLADGTRLGHPPVHIHHIHFVAQQGVRFRNVMRNLCLSATGAAIHTVDTMVKERNCYNSSLFLEQHGDYQCKPEDDGIECLTAGDHNSRRIAQVLDVEGELNDVRPFASEPMVWYYQVALRWRPLQPQVRPVSQMTIMAPGGGPLDDQLTRVITFPTPTHAEHFIWYTGNLWATGELLRNKLHAHNLVFESSGFFAASPTDLGLDEPRFRPRVSYNPLTTTADLGFESNAQLAAYLFENLRNAQSRWDRLCLQQLGPTDRVCQRPRPRWVCAATYDSDAFLFGPEGAQKEFLMDRRPHTWCESWSFREGDPFTVIGFSRQLTRPTIPPYPDIVPPTVPGHISWHFWYYHAGRGNSFFGRVVCNQEGIFFNAADKYGFSDLVGKIGSGLYAGGIPVDNTPFRVFKYSSIVAFLAAVGAVAYAGFKRKRD